MYTIGRCVPGSFAQICKVVVTCCHLKRKEGKAVKAGQGEDDTEDAQAP